MTDPISKAHAAIKLGDILINNMTEEAQRLKKRLESGKKVSTYKNQYGSLSYYTCYETDKPNAILIPCEDTEVEEDQEHFKLITAEQALSLSKQVVNKHLIYLNECIVRAASKGFTEVHITDTPYIWWGNNSHYNEESNITFNALRNNGYTINCYEKDHVRKLIISWQTS